MNKLLVRLAACFTLLTLPAFPAGTAFARVLYRCHMCGMDAAKSQTEFVAHLEDGGTEHTCCLHCLYLLEKFMAPRRFDRVETRDFSSGTLIDAKSACYLEGSSLIPRGSMAPFLPAFPDEETAGKYKRKYKGSILAFPAAMEAVAKFDEEVSAQ